MKTVKTFKGRKCKQGNALPSYHDEKGSRSENMASWNITGTENSLITVSLFLHRVLSCSLEDLRRLVERWLQFWFI
jgi:hypothetical protein